MCNVCNGLCSTVKPINSPSHGQQRKEVRLFLCLECRQQRWRAIQSEGPLREEAFGVCKCEPAVDEAEKKNKSVFLPGYLNRTSRGEKEPETNWLLHHKQYGCSHTGNLRAKKSPGCEHKAHWLCWDSHEEKQKWLRTDVEHNLRHWHIRNKKHEDWNRFLWFLWMWTKKINIHFW